MHDRNESSKAFIETGALVLGGITGGGASYLVFGDSWILSAIFAVGGGWLAGSLTAARYRKSER